MNTDDMLFQQSRPAWRVRRDRFVVGGIAAACLLICAVLADLYVTGQSPF